MTRGRERHEGAEGEEETKEKKSRPEQFKATGAILQRRSDEALVTSVLSIGLSSGSPHSASFLVERYSDVSVSMWSCIICADRSLFVCRSEYLSIYGYVSSGQGSLEVGGQDARVWAMRRETKRVSHGSRSK